MLDLGQYFFSIFVVELLLTRNDGFLRNQLTEIISKLKLKTSQSTPLNVTCDISSLVFFSCS